MSKPEKKDFLSNDFTERMIRIEQNVSASFNKPLDYNKTAIFKGLTPEQKIKFIAYLKSKVHRKIAAILFLAIPIFVFVLLNINFTGNVVQENLDEQNIFLISEVIIGVLVFLIFFLVIIFLRKKLKDRWFRKKTSSIDEIIARRHSTKKHKVFK